MTTFNQPRLSQLLTRALGGRLMSEYANDAGISLTYVSELIRQERSNPPQPRTLKKLALAAKEGVTYEDLMSACGHLPADLNMEENGMILGSSEFHQLPPGKMIPIMGAVRCGPGGVAFDDLQGEVAVSQKEDHLFALYCKGQSMTGLGIYEGDIAIIQPQKNLSNGDLAVVVIDNEEGTLKKFYKKNKMVILEAANPDYPTRILSGSDLEGFYVVGKVVETRRIW